MCRVMLDGCVKTYARDGLCVAFDLTARHQIGDGCARGQPVCPDASHVSLSRFTHNDMEPVRVSPLHMAVTDAAIQGLDAQDALPVKPLRRRAPSSRQFLVFEVCITSLSLGII